MIREVEPSDAERICRIYNHYVRHTTITFEEEPVPVEAMQARIAEVRSCGLPWIVCYDAGELLGYACAGKWKARSAYRHSVESSVYLDEHRVGERIGSALYEELLSRLRTASVHVVVGGVALPNEASVHLHEKFGFRKVAHFQQIGFKCGRWIDVGYWQLLL